MQSARFPGVCAGKMVAPTGSTSPNAARFFLARKEISRSARPANRQTCRRKLKFRQDVYLAEISLGPLYCMYYGVKNNRRYQPLPRFPGVERDFSLFLAEGVAFAEVPKPSNLSGFLKSPLSRPPIFSAAKMFRREIFTARPRHFSEPGIHLHRRPNQRLLQPYSSRARKKSQRHPARQLN